MDHPLDSYPKTLFVSGSGRSGTNVTKQIFSRHSAVATLPFEYRFTIDPRGVVDFLNTYPQAWSPFWPEQKIKDFICFLIDLADQGPEKAERVQKALKEDPDGLSITPPSYPGWELEKWIPGYSTFVQELESELVSFSYRGVWPGAEERIKNHEMVFAPHHSKETLLPILRRFLDKVTRSILKTQKKDVFLEDNTYNILFANDLLDLYPNAKLLHVIRDPRDVVASVQQQRWTPTHLMHVIAWYEQIMARWKTAKAQCDQSRIKEIRFEDLVGDTKIMVVDVCEFFELPFEEDMLKEDISKHHVGRYKEAFEAVDLELLNKHLSPYLDQFGYSTR